MGLVIGAVAMTVAGFATGVGAAQAGSSRGAVTIASNGDFTTCGCVTAGNGTPFSPYVIGPYQIGAESPKGYAVKIDNSGHTVTAAFAISGISVGYNDTNPSHPVIWLADVSGTPAAPITVSNISANNDGTGVEIDGSTWVTMDQLNINKMNGPGVFIDGSSNISMSNSKLKATSNGQPPHTEDGVYVRNSSYLNIGGIASCPSNQICNSFDYDSGWGVYLQNASHVTISHASANADDTGGFVLDNSSFVDVHHSVAQASGPICISVNGQKIPSGYVSDLQGGLLLINGSSNNVIADDAFAADKGYDVGSGGNGFFANPCTKTNQPFSPVETAGGSGNTFPGTCFTTTDIAGLKPSPCN
jgi:hypothetical protein